MDGKCGICGDPANGPLVNQPGANSEYTTGLIRGRFGAVISITFDRQIVLIAFC